VKTLVDGSNKGLHIYSLIYKLADGLYPKHTQR